MDDKHLNLENRGWTDADAAQKLFPKVLHRKWLAGFFIGILLMAILDLGDLHICMGECDGAGYDIMDIKNVVRK